MFCLPPAPLTDRKSYRKLRRSKYNIHGTCLPGNATTTTKKQKQKENLLAKLKIRVKLLLVSSWSVTYRFF